MIDWSATIAGIALILALASPLITSWMNNRHQLKMKEIEIFHERRLELISHYLEVAGRIGANSSSKDNVEYRQAYGKALIYLPPELFEETQKLHTDTLDFYQLIRKFSEYGFTPKQKLW